MLQAKAAKAKAAKRKAGADEESDDNSQEDAVAPALRDRFSHDAFTRCSKLVDALVGYMVEMESTVPADIMPKLVRSALFGIVHESSAQFAPVVLIQHYF